MGSESLFKECKKCKKVISKSVRVCPACGAKQNKLSILHWLGIALITFFIIGIMNSPHNEVTNADSGENSASNVSMKDKIKDKLELDFSWKKGGFNTVMEADFAIKNGSTLDIKDIEITCIHFAKSGTKIDSNERTIYEIIPAGSTKLFRNFNMGFVHEQARSSSCQITNFSLVN